MNPILSYMLKTAFCLAAFYLVYSTMLSKDTMYSRNRAFILFTVISALVLPFITIETNRPVGLMFFGKTLSEVLITSFSKENLNGFNGTGTLDWTAILLNIYFAGLILTGARFFINLMELIILILRKTSSETNIIRFHRLNTSGFSAIGYVFINSRLPESDVKEIIKHEMNHINHNHFFDILFIEFVKIVQWFNPFIYMIDRSLRAIHEFQADEGCLKSGVPVFNYQQLLMSQVFRSKTFNITNSFSNPTLIKKRMIMMTKERSGMLANLKLLMVLPVIAIVMIAFSSCKEKTNSSVNVKEEVNASQPVAVDGSSKVISGSPAATDEMAPPPPPPPPPVSASIEDDPNIPFVKVDEMPIFRGGDEAMINFIKKNTNYPEVAKKNGITGKVIVRFAVETNGTIDKISILKGVDPALDAEALRVISLLPAFEKPGIIKGNPVSVWYMMPINFTLK